ncbi:MAG: phosphoribosyltransferase family protein [Simkaniaceae bacterium]|nr:phosphoribosyltransferase family protein [Candidatus Sacchlamyda saccharinae]
MIFQNRTEAGKLLAKELMSYKGEEDVVAVGLARGGVVVAAQVSKALEIPLDVMVVRKIGAPDNPELALGAIAEKGRGIFNDDLITLLGISKEYLKKETEKEREVVLQRRALYLRGREGLDFSGKTVLLIDDGVATGASMKVAIASCIEQKASKVVVAVPVAPTKTCKELEELASEVVCLETPKSFPAVGAFYKEFDPVSDEQIIQMI